MTSTELIKVSNNNTFKNVNYYIENSVLDIELIQSLPFMKMWKVNNNKEFSYITNALKSLDSDVSELTFAFN